MENPDFRRGAWGIYVAKAARVFVFGVVSVATPVYFAGIGFPPLLVGAVIAAMIAGSAFSNVVLARYEGAIGRRRFLIALSLLMFGSGVALSLSTSLPVVLSACFIGNVSTTGTESGPFQSIEAGVLPGLVTPERRNRSFAVYNMIGYSASSVGAFVASTPSYLHDSLGAFQALYLLYGLVGLILAAIYSRLGRLDASPEERTKPPSTRISDKAKRDITRLSALFSIDAFGGGFVSQSLLVYWFYLVYHVSLGDLGLIFLVVNLITALSTVGSYLIADRIGNLRTMVYTHLLSNVFLFFIPLAASFPLALAFLFARQSVSQMDVPTRQAFMIGIFNDEERVTAFATTNTVRIVSSVPGSPATGALLGAGLASAPLLIASTSKILYDLLIFSIYRRRQR